jgi:oligosaccharide repeat unit polymerase
MFSDLTWCWIGFSVSAWAVIRTYMAERHLYGGLGLATLLAASVVLYNLTNPFFYLISPILAANFAVYIGLFQPASFFLPNILATTAFLVCLAQATQYVHPMPTVPQSEVLPGIPPGRVTTLLWLVLGLALFGSLLFICRNIVAFGSWTGSFSAEYAGETARPQVPVFSSYETFWIWGTSILTVVCLWQAEARQAPRAIVALPILVGCLFAIAEGNRTVLGTAILLVGGWYGLRMRLSAKKILAGVLLLMLLTLMANARYHKEETNLLQRVADIFNPQYFRPFWGSDPVGPAVAATIECANTNRTGIYFGAGYLSNALSMIPRSLWPGRPDGGTVRLAREYADEQGKEYAEGTGFAYNAIAEAFRDFGYFGACLLGLGCAWISARITRASLTLGNVSGRCLFAVAVMFIVWNVPRNTVMVFLSPMFLLNYALASLLLRACHPKRISWLRSPVPTFFLTVDSTASKSVR